jgi:small-conductance mechanosensitive channel
MPSNNLIIVPNGRLAESTLTNYNLPDPAMSCSLPVTVAPGNDPARVLSILVDEAKRAIAEVPGLVPSFEPIARFNPGFTEQGLGFLLIVRVTAFIDQFAVLSDLRERILRRFQAEGIEFPVTTRRIHAPELERLLAVGRGDYPGRSAGE